MLIIKYNLLSHIKFLKDNMKQTDLKLEITYSFVCCIVRMF